ncbi:MAG: GC-type dockerin domain-anchored protein [Phycisphaerales bacterium]
MTAYRSPMARRLSVACTMLAAGQAFAVPPNNDRANAIPVTIGTPVTGTLTTATNDAAVSGACGSSSTSPDVWYVLGPVTSNNGVKFSTCGGVTWDSVLQAFESGPGNTLGAQVACNDDDSSCGTPSSITFGTAIGHTYLIRVASFNNGAGGAFTMTSQTVEPPPPASSGPDVTVGNCLDIANYGTQTINGVLVRGFAVGTDAWNIGDRPAGWYNGTNRHPVIGQHMYRLKDGKFEQIGLSWLKHGFASTNSNAFGTCQPPPDGGSQLGVNCSDAYGSGLNGSRSYLGPRFDVNPISGNFTANWSTLVGPTPGGNDVASRRLQVPEADWNNANSQYWVDTHYVTADDALWGNSRNNLSYRKLSVTSASSGAFDGGTVQRHAGIEAWPTVDPTVTLVPVDFHEVTQTALDPLGGPSQQKQAMARFFVASKVTANGNGTYSYEYAIANINSHRAAKGFRVRTPSGAVISNTGFHAPLYHSGDRIDNSAWQNSSTGGMFTSSTNMSFPPTMTIPGTTTVVATQPNYVYWGTLYNVRFVSNVAPTTGRGEIDLGRGPADATGFQGTSLAVTGIKVPTVCGADVGSAGAVLGPDGMLDNNDFIAYIGAFFANDLLISDVGKAGGVTGPDNQLDNNDFIAFINVFFSGCN